MIVSLAPSVFWALGDDFVTTVGLLAINGLALYGAATITVSVSTIEEDGLVNTRHLLSPVVATTLAASLSLGAVVPTVAFADSLESQVNEAQSRLNELYYEAEQRNYELEATVGELNDTNAKLEETNDAIAQTQSDLAVARKHLAEVVAENYKAGDISLLQLLFESSDFDNLISRVVYANKVATYHADAVNEVNTLKDSLKEQQDTYTKEQARQKELVAEQQARKDETDAAVSQAEAYYNQLSDELKSQIQAQKAAAAAAAVEANQEGAAAAERQAAEEQSAQSSSSSESSSEAQTSNESTESSESSEATESTQTSSSSSNRATTGNEAPASSVAPAVSGSAAAMVAQAYKAIGSAYSYSGYYWTGNPSTSWFTCSGLIDFALGRPTNSSWPASLYSEVEGLGNMKHSLGSLNYGDLVFTGYGSVGHVGIYVGGGQYLDASYDGVSVRAVNTSTFIGGGSIF